jgi:tetratricopeptide (TPR) repeat protein
VIEDLHWADPLTLAHAAELALTVAACPALLVLTARTEGDPLGPEWRARARAAPCRLLTIDLGPLQPEEARVLAQQFFAANAAFAERCVDWASGNPLFLEQLLRHAQENQEAGVPGSVQSLVQARLDRLDPLDRAALQAASTLGQRFDQGALSHLLDRPDYAPERLAAHLLVRPQGGCSFLFAHALIRDAVYDSLLRSRRRKLHRRAADWFANQGDPVLRAQHLDRAEDAEAARAYLAAARAQAAAYHYEVALHLVERGVALARDQVDRFALTCFGGDILHDLGAMADARRAYELALSLPVSDAERDRAWIGLAAVKRMTDDLEGALADLERAERAATARGEQLAERARIHLLRGNLCFPRGDIAGCLREHGQSLELARQAGSAELEAAALGGLGDAEYMRGRMLSADDWFRRCIELCQRHGFGRIEVANRPMASITRWFAGDARGALDDALASVDAAARVGHRRAEIIGHHATYFCTLFLTELGTKWNASLTAFTIVSAAGYS